MSLGSPRFCWYSSCVRRDYSDEAARSRLMPQTPLSVSHPAMRRGVNAGPWSLGWVLVVLAVLAFYPGVQELSHAGCDHRTLRRHGYGVGRAGRMDGTAVAGPCGVRWNWRVYDGPTGSAGRRRPLVGRD